MDLWEDACGWMNGTAKNHMFDLIFQPMLKFIDTNVYHKCPFNGTVYIKANDMTTDTFLTDFIVPHGRYYADIAFYEQRNDPTWMFRAKFYFEISDHRVEMF